MSQCDRDSDDGQSVCAVCRSGVSNLKRKGLLYFRFLSAVDNEKGVDILVE